MKIDQGYRLRLDNEGGSVVPAEFTDPFNVYSVEVMNLVAEPLSVTAGLHPIL